MLNRWLFNYQSELDLPSKLLDAAPTEFDMTTLLSINDRYSSEDDVSVDS